MAQDKRFLQRVRIRTLAVTERRRRAHAKATQAGSLPMTVLRPHRKPRLMLLPGLDGTGSLLRGFRDALDPSIRTIVISYPLYRELDYAALEEIARSRLPRRKQFVLLAESFSGPIAISIAADRPAGLRGVILACSFARNPVPVLAPLSALVQFLPVRWAPAVLLARPTLGRFQTPILRSQLAHALSRVSPWVIRKRLRAVLEVDVSALLSRVDVPVLYLRASEDRLVPRAISDELTAVPRIRFVEIEAPHFLLQVRPSAAAAHVRGFLRNIDALSDQGSSFGV